MKNCDAVNLSTVISSVMSWYGVADHFEAAKDVSRMLVKTSLLCGVFQGLLLLLLAPIIIMMVELTPVAKEHLCLRFCVEVSGNNSVYYFKFALNCEITGILPAL